MPEARSASTARRAAWIKFGPALVAFKGLAQLWRMLLQNARDGFKQRIRIESVPRAIVQGLLAHRCGNLVHDDIKRTHVVTGPQSQCRATSQLVAMPAAFL